MHPTVRRAVRNTVRVALSIAFWLGRRDGVGEAPARALLRGAGQGVARLRGVPSVADGESLGRWWQRAFPVKIQVPVVRTDETTAYAEIHTRCPLRGTGDVAACHRTMAYDRAFVESVGGTFVVLQSQAEPGVEVCQVAMRVAGHATADLVPAHVRVGAAETPAE